MHRDDSQRSVLSWLTIVSVLLGLAWARAGIGHAAHTGRVALDGPLVPQATNTCGCTPTPTPTGGWTPPPKACPLSDQWVVAAAGSARGAEGVLAAKDSNSGTGDLTRQFAHGGTVGQVYGLAYDFEHDVLYAAAYHRACSAFGPAGPGGIYRIEPRSGRVTELTRLEAGPSRHGDPPTCPDPPSARWAGRTGLGDLEVDDDGRWLFVVNLHDRRIYRLAADDGAVLDAFDHGAAAETWADRARPFGLGWRDDWLYHGVVDDAVGSDAPPAGYVYRSRSDGSDMALVARVPLGYRAEPRWGAWRDDSVAAGPLASVQPIISDVDFRPGGDMIIALRAREVDQTTCTHSAYGDLLQARRRGLDQWEVTGQADFYRDDRGLPELAFGGIVAALETDRVIASVRDPLGNMSGGLFWFDNARGTIKGPADGREVLLSDSGPWLGDVDIACVSRPAVVPSPTPSAVLTATPTDTATATATDADTATATRPVGTATLTATSSATPSASATGTPSRTATPARWTIYVPVTSREACRSKDWYSDIVLIVDLSTSMRREAGSGRSKLAATTDAAGWFVDHMPGLQPDDAGGHAQVALVGFNASAWIETPLTGDRSRLHEGLARLPGKVLEGTRLDLAIERGAEAAGGDGHRPGNRKVIVLLTDGLPNKIPPGEDGTMEGAVLERARDAKKAGCRVYTIAIGEPEDTNPELLTAVASEPPMYYYMPDADDLVGVFAQIQGEIACP